MLQDTEKMLSTNVHGLITMTRHILPGMVARNRGHVFNIGSTAGHEAYAGGAIYCATKFAVRGFTDALRHDVCGTQVRMLCCRCCVAECWPWLRIMHVHACALADECMHCI